MNNKELYKRVRRNVKGNFWIYVASVLIFFIINMAASNGFGIFSNISKVISAIRNGSFNYQQLSNPQSQFWAYFYAGGGLQASGAMSIIVTALSFFLVNPFSVGIKSVFLSGVDGRPSLERVSHPFKNNYLNVVVTMLLSNLVLDAVIMGVAILYMMAMGMAGSVVSVAGGSNGMILLSIVSVILTILYMIASIYISYSFSMIAYILAEHSEYRFSQSLYISRRMVHKKKWKIFRVDFHYLKWSVLSILVPIALFAIGMAKLTLSAGGMLYILVSIFMIIPVICINVFVSVFKDSAWAHIYKELKIETEHNTTGFAESVTEEDNE